MYFCRSIYFSIRNISLSLPFFSDKTNDITKDELGCIKLLQIGSWALIVLLFLQPGTAHRGAVEGMRIFTTALLPYLLPYLVITQLFISITKNFFKYSKNKFKLYLNIYLLSAIGGFPSGAAIISSLKEIGSLNERNASWLLAICHAPSPMFVIGFVGIEIFHAEVAGLKLINHHSRL